jgi:hypothetical protein
MSPRWEAFAKPVDPNWVPAIGERVYTARAVRSIGRVKDVIAPFVVVELHYRRKWFLMRGTYEDFRPITKRKRRADR